MSQVVEPGQILAGKYRVERVLGQGGMGVVVSAMHLQLGQHVALKFLLPHMCQHPEAIARFSREARAAVQIQSEHVARVTDVGTLESGAPYMVMEFLSGADLGEVLQKRGPLPIAEAVGYVLQACEAIAEAHSLGIVHRDLKPANLFLTRRRDGSPLVKVLDFGISKALQETLSSPSVTSTTAVMGSPLYMSPEQVRSSKNVDARSDVWALGVIVQELLTGAPSYEAETASALMAMIAADPPTPLRQKRPDAPAQLEAVILHCLQKDREKRMPNVAALARALGPFAAPEARVSVERIARVLGDTQMQNGQTLASAVSLPGSSVNATGAAWGHTQSSSRATLGAVVAVFSLLALGAVGAGAWWWKAHRAAASASAEPSVGVAAAPVAVAQAVPASAAPSAPADAQPSVLPLLSATPPPSAALIASAAPVVVRPAGKRGEPRRAPAHNDLFDDNK